MWVFQEYIAGKKRIFLCGSLIMSQEIFLNAVLVVKLSDSLSSSFGSYVQAQKNAEPVGDAADLVINSKVYENSRRIGLFRLMNRSKHLRASDPRDQIFAAIELAYYPRDDLIDYKKS
jgi:hypothetical protein